MTATVAIPCSRQAFAVSIAYSAHTGVVVGECDAATLISLRSHGDRLRGCLIAEFGDLARFADIPILAELATEVAASGTKGQNAGAWIEVIQGFLLDRIDTKTRAFAIGV